MSFDSQYAFNDFYEILQAAPVAVLVTVVSAFLGLFGGMLFCVVRLRRIPVLNTIVGLLVSLIRSTPILVQLYVVCYGMPRIVAFVHQNPKFVSNVTIYPNTVAIVTFTLYASAYFCEIFRSAYFTVGEGQRESIKSLNLPAVHAVSRIIIPQAAINAVPNISNSVIDMLKNTSLLYTISVMDIMARATIIGSESFKYSEVYADALIVYLGIAIILFVLFAMLERMLKRFIPVES